VKRQNILQPQQSNGSRHHRVPMFEILTCATSSHVGVCVAVRRRQCCRQHWGEQPTHELQLCCGLLWKMASTVASHDSGSRRPCAAQGGMLLAHRTSSKSTSTIPQHERVSYSLLLWAVCGLAAAEHIPISPPAQHQKISTNTTHNSHVVRSQWLGACRTSSPGSVISAALR
jgi:hypothetical protein